jgi:hypothetical protein
LIIDLLFFIDILFNFRTTYTDSSTGDEIGNPKKIAKHYVLGRFWIDLLSSIPLDQLAMVKDNILFIS